MKLLFAIVLFLVTSLHLLAQDTVAKKKVSWTSPDYNNLYKGKEYVPFVLTTLDGKQFSNVTSKGKVTLINFWFESCVGCRHEFGELNELYDSLKTDSKCQFVAVTFDDVQTLPPFIKEHSLRYPIATTGNSDVLHRLNYGMGCPSIILLDKEGRILHVGNNSIVKGKAASSYELSINDVLAMVREAELSE